MGEYISTREAYGEELCRLGADENIVAFDADLSICTMSSYFGKKYPERFINAGIAECNMIGMAAGMAATGKTAFCHSFAMFTAGRGYDQIRNSVAYTNLNVKIVGTHAGLSVGEDGATHQCIEDLSLMRTIPGMTVVCPADANETALAARAIAAYKGPCYLRLGRAPVENVTASVPGYRFELGKGAVLKDGGDATIIATGLMVQIALEASRMLGAEGISIRVIDMHTIKPVDSDIIIKAAKETGAIVTAEEHNVIGGLGSAVLEVLGEAYPVPVCRLGVEDVFGHSGTVEALMPKYGLTAENAVSKLRSVLRRKAGK
jgi:transketolase